MNAEPILQFETDLQAEVLKYWAIDTERLFRETTTYSCRVALRKY